MGQASWRGDYNGERLERLATQFLQFKCVELWSFSVELIVIRSAKVVGILRHLLRVHIPNTCLIDVVKIGIEAPATVPVHRQEVYEEIQRNNEQALTRQNTSLPTLINKPSAVPTEKPAIRIIKEQI